ncbi:hypothetical protein E4U43_001059 [Claviceps pusilla]|uniref:Uncharacterized protein n=1 Tax=Claviceps pusilla TaxID=123648 RepID=A0A9P7NAW1_9HYPO|nr:hypothetical protein E4U43_001059 [Claviceps pusilla]
MRHHTITARTPWPQIPIPFHGQIILNHHGSLSAAGLQRIVTNRNCSRWKHKLQICFAHVGMTRFWETKVWYIPYASHMVWLAWQSITTWFRINKLRQKRRLQPRTSCLILTPTYDFGREVRSITPDRYQTLVQLP